jgi:hypothetical protein
MNNTILYAMMISTSLLMAMLPFAMFMGIGTLVGVPSNDWRIWVGYLCLTLLASFGMSLGSFVLVQKSNCGEIRNFKQISLNALLSTSFQAGMFLIVGLIPWFRNVIKDLMPPDLDENIQDSVSYSYYSFWAMMFGMALGGTFSGSCAKPL